MRYTRMREWLARTNRDMRSRDRRNPYGSRGGYVTTGRDRSDYRGDMNYDYARGRDRNYDMDYARGRGRDRNYDMDYAREDMHYGSMGDYGRSGEYAGRYTTNDYTGRDYEMHDMGSEQYRQSGRDYADDEYKLTSKDLKKWQRKLKNADGTNGYKFEADQVRQIAMQHNIHFDEYSPELLTTVANMLYSDYCKVLGGDITTYVKLAKAFLEDEDFDGEPEEKAYLYYTAIVEDEE